MAYSYDRWRALRLNPDIKPGDAPQGTFSAPESEWWPVKFSDGIETVFTPKLRYVSNQDQPAVIAGYDVMIKVAEGINKLASDRGIQVVFTIIPTKELVYWPKVRQSKFKVPHDYTKLIEAEQHNIAVFEKAILALWSRP